MSENDKTERAAKRQKAERYIATARLILVWERIWPALWPGMGIIGFGMILALVGFFEVIPGWIHVVLLVVLFGATVFALWRTLARLRKPGWDDAARRVERDSDLPNRPITEGSDTVAAGKGDPFAEKLWRAHIVRLLASAANLRLRLPSPGLGRRDPRGIRFVVLAGLIIGFVVAGYHSWQRLVSGLTPVFADDVDNSVFVAWVAPPDYTNLPPRSLTDTTVKSDSGTILAPVNSMLVMRLRGTDTRPTIDARPVPKGGQPKFVKGDSGYEAKFAITAASRVSVRLGSHNFGDWSFAVIPDKPPTIAFTEAPQAQQNGSLKIAYKASDDYGVVKAAILVKPLDAKGQEVKDAETLSVDLPVPGSGKEITDTVYRDLTSNAYAGSNVHIALQATDAAGQAGTSLTQTIKLPQRVFTEPLAQALIEQRKNIAVDGEKGRPKAQAAIDGLGLGPEEFFKEDYGNYLAMRALNYQLDTPNDPQSSKNAQDFMWDMALAIDDGDLANVAEELRHLQDELMDALERGAPDDEIKALMDKLRQAMARYMQQLARNAQKGGQMAQLPPNARMMTQRDLQDLLKMIEDLARTGNRDEARQMLQALMQMMENMRMARGGPGGQGQQGQQGQQTPQQRAMNEALQGLSDLMNGQRQLLDKTFRAQRGQQGQQGQQQGQQGGQQGQNQFGQSQGQGQYGQGSQGQFGQGTQGYGNPGQQPGQGPNGQQQGQPGGAQPGLDSNTLAQQQQALREQLNKVIQGLGQNGVPTPDTLNGAGQAMTQSHDNLSGDQLQTAEDAQQRALQQLSDTAQQLAKNILAQNQQGQGQQGDQKTDPLGRPLDQAGSMAGGTVKLPDQSELARARAILEELQRRSGEANRAEDELEYIQRLLKQF